MLRPWNTANPTDIHARKEWWWAIRSLDLHNIKQKQDAKCIVWFL